MSEFEGAVQRLKLSAIDAFMCGKGGGGSKGGNSQIVYDPHFPTESFYITTEGLIIRPYETTGEGGGMKYSDSAVFGKETETCWAVGKFDDIRTSIEEAVGRWRGLPASRGIGELCQAFHDEVFTRFQGHLEEQGRATILDYGKGTLFQNLGDIYRWLLGPGERATGQLDPNEGLKGISALFFKGYIQNLFNTVCACEKIVDGIDRNLQSEKDLWEKASSDATQTIVKIADVCDRLAKRKSDGLDLNGALTVAAFGFGVLALPESEFALAAGLISLALSAVAAGGGQDFDLLEYVDPKKPDIPSSSKAIEVLSFLMNDCVGTVNSSVTITEQAIFDTLQRGIEAIEQDDGGLFDPKPGPITEVSSDMLDYDPYLATNIPILMGYVGDELLAAANAIVDCMGMPGDVMRRDERIGIGNDGPYHKFFRIMHLLEAVLRELSGELYAAADNFQAAMAARSQAEANAEAQLQQMAGRFASADVGELDVENWESAMPSHPGHEYYEWLQRKPVIPDLERRMMGE